MDWRALAALFKWNQSVTRVVRFAYFHVRRVEPEFSSTRKLRDEAEIIQNKLREDA
jgi:hypothetical protein